MDRKKLKIYDLNALLKDECNLEPMRYKKVAVFEGKTGILVAEEEGVYQAVCQLSDSICIGANKPAQPGKAWVLPAFEVSLPIVIVKTAPSEEMSMESFFSRRNYNPRCQENWKNLLSELSRIGFDLNGYLPEKAPLGEKIMEAKHRTSTCHVADNPAPQHEL